MKSKAEPHRHDFKKLGFVRDFGSASRTNELIHEVVRRNIRRIILVRLCDCGQSQAFECGDQEKMRALYRKLMEGTRNEPNSTRSV